MALFSLFSRNKRTGILWNATDHIVQVARLGRIDQRPLRVDQFAELTPGDDEALAQWLRGAFPERPPGYMPAYCGFHPVERVLLRETVTPRRLTEPNYLTQLVAD